MTRTEVVVRAQERIPELTYHQVSACCNTLLEVISDAIAAGHNVTLPMLGEFRVKLQHARKGEIYSIPKCLVVYFYPHKNLKKKLNKGE